jgi:hypothetical protein
VNTTDMQRAAGVVDTGHPRYRDGERAAQVLLDLALLSDHPGVGSILDVANLAELRASVALSKGDDETYLKARGLGDTLRERYEDWGT